MSASYVLEMFDVTRENHILLPLVTKLHLELSVNNVMNRDGGSFRCFGVCPFDDVTSLCSRHALTVNMMSMASFQSGVGYMSCTPWLSVAKDE